MRAEMAVVACADARLVEWFKHSVAEGKHWYVALLETIHAWSLPVEDYDGRHYRYLLDDEAFDWLMLAERLCEELDGHIPDSERTALLFFGEPPMELSQSEFRDLIGSAKYRTHLNYFYGVVVERFLVLAVMQEIRKKRRVAGVSSDDGVADEAHHRIYGACRAMLVRQFRKGKCYAQLKSIGLEELDEFTYWLFKRRVEKSDKSCVASDTKKALGRLQELAGRGARSSRPTVTRETRPGIRQPGQTP